MAVDTVDVRETPNQVLGANTWAEDLDTPIRLARFDCCGQYVCRCRQEEEGAVTR